MIKVRIARETDFQDIAQVYIETWRDSYAGTLPDRVLIDMKKEKLVVSFSQTLQHHSEVLVVAEDIKEGIVVWEAPVETGIDAANTLAKFIRFTCIPVTRTKALVRCSFRISFVN